MGALGGSVARTLGQGSRCQAGGESAAMTGRRTVGAVDNIWLRHGPPRQPHGDRLRDVVRRAGSTATGSAPSCSAGSSTASRCSRQRTGRHAAAARRRSGRTTPIRPRPAPVTASCPSRRARPSCRRSSSQRCTCRSTGPTRSGSSTSSRATGRRRGGGRAGSTTRSPTASRSPRSCCRSPTRSRDGDLDAHAEPGAAAATRAGRCRSRGLRARGWRHRACRRRRSSCGRRSSATPLTLASADGAHRRQAPARARTLRAALGQPGLAQARGVVAPAPDRADQGDRPLERRHRQRRARRRRDGRAGAVRARPRREPRDLTTMVPVNLRPAGEPLPRELGNRFALAMLPMPCGETRRAGRASPRPSGGWTGSRTRRRRSSRSASSTRSA